jgi:uncharacterized membrane protein YciS (DUF1049 family)
MRTFKFMVLFLIAFILAWIILATFTQAPFKTPVSAVVLWYQTPALPIFWYVAGAVCLGVIIGMLIMLSPLWGAWTKLRSANKKITQLENSFSPVAAAAETTPVHTDDNQ